MESLGAFVMIGLLYLASTLGEVESIKYTGESSVRDNQPWNITCSEVPPSATIKWTRNGQELLEDLSTGLMHVEPVQTGEDQMKSSTLVATNALERHEGSYSCSEGNETFRLTIVYDVELKVLPKNGSSVVLDCPAAKDGEKVEWFKEKKPLTLFKLIKAKNTTVTVLSPDSTEKASEVYGNYTCKVGNSSEANYRIVRKPNVHMQDATNVVEGEKLHLTCAVKVGDPGLKIYWTFRGEKYMESRGRVRLERDEEKRINNAVFHLDNVQMDDRGPINCTGYYNISDTNPEHFDVASTFVRVKDKLAALWPFLGIVAEVVILCLIILIYEKKRNKSEMDESDTDQSPDTKPTPNKDSDVRQRK